MNSLSATQPLVTQSSTALKEWAVICAALREGLQTVLLRKGGIHDRGGVFSPEHRAFWLYPTFEHQQPAYLQPAYHRLLEQVIANPTRDGHIALDSFATVEQIRLAADQDWLQARLDRLIWSEDYLKLRFDYKPNKPLYVLSLRVYRLPQAHWLQARDSYAGCVSWLPLAESLLTGAAEPVLSDAEFAQQAEPFV